MKQNSTTFKVSVEQSLCESKKNFYGLYFWTVESENSLFKAIGLFSFNKNTKCPAAAADVTVIQLRERVKTWTFLLWPEWLKCFHHPFKNWNCLVIGHHRVRTASSLLTAFKKCLWVRGMKKCYCFTGMCYSGSKVCTKPQKTVQKWSTIFVQLKMQ